MGGFCRVYVGALLVTASKLCFTIEVAFSSWRSNFFHLVSHLLFKGINYRRTILYGITEGFTASAITGVENFLS